MTNLIDLCINTVMVNHLIIDNEYYIYEYSDEQILDHIKKNINYGVASAASDASDTSAVCCGLTDCFNGQPDGCDAP